MFGDNITKLRRPADLKGYTVERAPIGERWRISGPKGNAALGRTGLPSFRYADAMKFLKKQTNVEVPFGVSTPPAN